MGHQNYEHFKRLVLDSPDSEADYIHGFDFECGYDYTIKVKETDHLSVEAIIKFN